MLRLKTVNKIKISSILSKILIFIYGNKKRKISRNNIFYEIDFNEGIDLSVFLNIKNDRKIFNIKKIINKDEKLNIVDIGANIGSLSLPLLKFFKNSNVLSIEPTIFAFKKLKKNVNLNPDLKKRSYLINYFISHKKKKINSVYSSWNYSQNSNKHKVHLGSLKKSSNKIISLDKLIQRINKKISFIKIDVDGHELEVLKSGTKVIKKDLPIIYIEFAPYLHKEFGYSTIKLIEFIENKIGYKIYNEDLKKMRNIRKYVKKIINSSENFFLIPKKIKIN